MQVSNSFLTGSKSMIGTSGVPVVNTTKKCERGIQLSAPNTNSGIVYISSVSSMTFNTSDSTDGFPLHSGDSVLIPIRDPAKVYVASPVGGQRINWMLF